MVTESGGRWQAAPVGEPTDDRPARVVAVVSGRVQGVGFRWWTRAYAEPLGLVGSATNLLDGRVEVVAEGPRPVCETLVRAILDGRPPGRVTDVRVRWEQPQGMTRFTVS
jgi:acylphosphatase